MSDFDVSEAVGELENMVNAAWDAGYAKGVDWAKKCGGGMDAMTDSELAERGLVRLPVDADGVPIHIGDEMVLQHEVAEKPYTVQSLTLDGEDWYFACDEGFFNACGWMHHHAPTVEDVLREFADEVWNRCCEGATASDSGIDELVAECAAKLRLAGENA